MLNINRQTEGNVLTVFLEGRLDTSTSPELEEALKDGLDDVEKLIFDIENLEYISSAGLRVLLSNHKKMASKGGMVVKNPSDVVSEVFDVTGFADILNIE